MESPNLSLLNLFGASELVSGDVDIWINHFKAASINSDLEKTSTRQNFKT